MKKKLVALTLVLTMVATVFTGCAKKNYTKDAEALLSFDKKATKITENVSYTNSDDLLDAAKKLNKKLEELEVKTDEAKEIKADYEQAAEYMEKLGKLFKKYNDGDISYSEFSEQGEALTEKMEKFSKDVEDHIEDFYDACEDAKIDDDLLDDIEDDMMD